MSGKTILILIILLAGIGASVQANQTIFIDPVGNQIAGERFNITGTTTIEKCTKIGVEIMPKEYWDDISKFARVNDTGRVKFREIASASDNINPTGINLIRYNEDGTQTYQPFNISEDYAVTLVQVKKEPDGTIRWNAEISEKIRDTPFGPGKYHVNVYDASREIDREGAIMQNGWDIIKKKIYPATTLPNIWDQRNEVDVEYAEFTIKNP